VRSHTCRKTPIQSEMQKFLESKGMVTMQQTEGALRAKTLELLRLEAELRANTQKLASAEQLLKAKMDKAADETAQAQAKSLCAQAMMHQLEEMLQTLEGIQLSTAGTVKFSNINMLASIGSSSSMKPQAPRKLERRVEETGDGMLKQWAERLHMRENIVLHHEASLAEERAQIQASHGINMSANYELIIPIFESSTSSKFSMGVLQS